VNSLWQSCAAVTDTHSANSTYDIGIPKRDATIMTAATHSSTQNPAQHNSTATEHGAVLTYDLILLHAVVSSWPGCYSTIDVTVLMTPQNQRTNLVWANEMGQRHVVSTSTSRHMSDQHKPTATLLQDACWTGMGLPREFVRRVIFTPMERITL
jgi:hypothetical protein